MSVAEAGARSREQPVVLRDVLGPACRVVVARGWGGGGGPRLLARGRGVELFWNDGGGARTCVNMLEVRSCTRPAGDGWVFALGHNKAVEQTNQ